MEELQTKIIYTRRVVFTAMRPYLDDVELQNAMTVWQEKYAQQTTHTFTQFLSETCRSITLKRNRPVILSAIMKAITLPENGLLADPLNAQTSELDILASYQSQHAEENLVFVQFVAALLKSLGDDVALSVSAYLMKHISTKLKLSQQQTVALKAWVHQSTPDLKAAFDNKQKREMINILYVALCQYVGPVKADQLLLLALKETESLAKAHAVDLHDYL